MYLLITLFLLIISSSLHAQNDEMVHQEDETSLDGNNQMNQQESHPEVFKQVLANGMTVLVRVVKTIPQVIVEILYRVGSKNEKDGERGRAHLIEHMIFKGTKKLSESDIDSITHKLSGSTNAFTSYDITGYHFLFPKQHYKYAFELMADFMENTGFKDDHLASEMKAVIQELKMVKDEYQRALMFDMISLIFDDHPYHHPIVGYKQDLWSATGKELRDFYKKHYHPANATLVVAGDVDPQEVFEYAKTYFGDIKPVQAYQQEQFYHEHDIRGKELTIHRDIQQSFVVLCYEVPGLINRVDSALDLLAWILGQGRGSRLYKRLVNKEKLVTSVEVDYMPLFDSSVLFIGFEPKSIDDVPEITTIIQEEIDDVAKGNISKEELERAIKKARMQFYGLLESNQGQAGEIGRYYLATGDHEYVYKYLQESPAELKEKVIDLAKNYLRASVRYKGQVLPIEPSEQDFWKKVQEESDALDSKILANHPRITPIEKPKYAPKIHPAHAAQFNYPKPQTFTLANGLKVLYYQNPNTPKIDISLDLKAKSYYDPEDKQGLLLFLGKMLMEGTKYHTANQLAEELENRGMSLSIGAGGASMGMLSTDFKKGLSILDEVLRYPTFPQEQIEKVRAQLLAELKSYWDEPIAFASQLVSQELYKNHPYCKNPLGTKESIESITQEDLKEAWKKFISPHGATIAIVGDLQGYNVEHVTKDTLGSWQGPEVKTIEFPALPPISCKEILYPINRDQVVLVFAGLSIDRKNPDYDKLQIFDQIFGGGMLGSMHSKLFQLRVQSGLFYSIAGSTISGADEQPGKVVVKTMVSVDRLAEAEQKIKETIDKAIHTVTPEEFDEAKRAIVNALISNFESNRSIANAFIWLNRYKFPANYFDERGKQLEKVSLDDMKKAVEKVLASNKVLTFKIGRVGTSKDAK